MATSRSWPVSALLLALGLVLCLGLLFRLLVLDSEDPYRCRTLLERGRWLEERSGPYTANHYQRWQPPGCMLHDYKEREIEQCLDGRRMLFVGDSTTRQIFWATAKKLNHTKAEAAALATERHDNVSFIHGRANLQFTWDPFLNSSTLYDELEAFRKTAIAATPGPRHLENVVVFVGGGLWHVRHMQQRDEAVHSFAQSVSRIANCTGVSRTTLSDADPSRIIEPPVNENIVLVAPVLVPNFGQLSPSRKSSILPAKVDALNGYLAESARSGGILIPWSFLLMSWQRPSAYEASGLHVVENVASRQADIVLNMRCNSAPEIHRYPFDKTCCTPLVTAGYRQGALASLVMSVCIGSLLLYRKLRNEYKRGADIFLALAIFCAALYYCFLADRTWVFENLNKFEQQTMFLLAVSILFVLGITTTAPIVRKAPERDTTTLVEPGVTFLSRGQTEEWKGWMQLIILAYHYTGTSTVLWIYEIMRLLVASYLFMTGFGHTIYFYTTNDFSLRRFAFVMFRLNILAYSLSLMMQTTYNYYYFPALSSFWFVVVYITCRVRNYPGAIPTVLVRNIVISAVVVTAIVKIPGILEHVFEVLKLICNFSVDIDEMRFRIGLDIYVVYVGMLSAILYLQIAGVAPCTEGCLASYVRRRLYTFQILTTVAAAITLPAFFLTIQRSPDKYDYNWWQPYISCLPILSFVVIRNSNAALRNHHAKLFAWVGKRSLETFVLQYHIWLAGDNKGLLRLGLLGRGNVNGIVNKLGDWQRLVEFIIITIYFLWTSWAVNSATEVMSTWIVGKPSRSRPSFPPSKSLGSMSLVMSRGGRTGSGLTTRGVDENFIPTFHHVRSEADDPREPMLPTENWWIVTTPGQKLSDRQLRSRLAGTLGIVWLLNWVF